MADPTLKEQILQDLEPLPGRLGSTSRIVLATVISLILLLVWQMPFASIGLYFIFLLSRDSPALSFRSGVFSLIAVMSAVAIEIGVVALTDNSPIARVLSVAVVGFVAGMITLGSNLPQLGPAYGLIFCTLIAFWENPAPADALVKNSLWLLAAFSLAVGCSIAVEYVFVSPRLAEKLQEQRRLRYSAMQKMFNAYAEGAPPAEIAEAVSAVQRLAAAGQGGMQALYNSIVERNLDTTPLPIGSRVRITMLAQLMDDAAAFGTHQWAPDDPSMKERCARIAQQCAEIAAEVPVEERFETRPRPSSTMSLLDHVEETLQVIKTMPAKDEPESDRSLISIPASKTPFWRPGALENPDTVSFALKVSLCATICYLVYHAVDWPGISTSVTTVFICAAGASGAFKQRIIYRFTGSVIGGFLAIAATAFLFPYIDSLTPLVIIIATVAFVSAWIAGGRRFGYTGAQLAFSFYLVAFEGFSAPTQLAPARDRLIGILLALVVMWFVFDQLWPVRTVVVMRKTLAYILHEEAAFLRISETTTDRQVQLRKADALRDQIGKNVAGLRTLNDAVAYEFGVNRDEHRRSSEIIVATALKAVSIFWNQLVILHRDEDRDFLEESRLAAMRHVLAERIDIMADAVARKTSFEPVAQLVDPEVLNNARFGEYAYNTTARFSELQAMVTDLNQQPV